MPNCLAQLRADGLPLSRQVSHHSTNRLIMRLSSLLRHGRGGCHLSLARAFARFRIEASNGSLRLCTTPGELASQKRGNQNERFSSREHVVVQVHYQRPDHSRERQIKFKDRGQRPRTGPETRTGAGLQSHPPKRERVPLFSNAADVWLAGKTGLAPKSTARYELCVSHLKKEFGKRLVCDIDANGVAEYGWKRLSAGVSNRTVNY